MSSKTDYLRRRALQERDAANRAADSKVREIHLEFAARYLAAADGGELANGDSHDGIAGPGILPSEFRILH